MAFLINSEEIIININNPIKAIQKKTSKLFAYKVSSQFSLKVSVLLFILH